MLEIRGHRPLRIAGPLHWVPLRVLAPQRGAVLGSPLGLPFFNNPRRFAWGSLIVISVIPLPPVWASCCHRSHYGLASTAPARKAALNLASSARAVPIGTYRFRV